MLFAARFDLLHVYRSQNLQAMDSTEANDLLYSRVLRNMVNG